MQVVRNTGDKIVNMGKKGTLCMLISITACLASAAVLGGTLVPCPDCGRDVSRRALMCPNCGLKGEVIAEVAKAIPEVAAGDVLDVDCGTCAAHALPVEMSDGKFAVLPFDPVLGAAKLKVSNRGCEVGWMVPELAVDAPIVRLRIAETNLVYWSVGGKYAFDGQEAKIRGAEVGAVVSPSISTNAFAISGREWQVLQPKQMTAHGRQVLKMLKGEPYELPERTHPYFKLLEKQRKEQMQ